MTKIPEKTTEAPVKLRVASDRRNGQWTVYGPWHGEERMLFSHPSVFKACQWAAGVERRLNEEL